MIAMACPVTDICEQSDRESNDDKFISGRTSSNHMIMPNDIEVTVSNVNLVY